MTTPSHSEDTYVSAVEIVAQRAIEIEASAGPGWTVEVERQPPYGWNLLDPSGRRKASGSLDQIAEWLAESRRVGSANWAEERRMQAEQRWPR